MQATPELSTATLVAQRDWSSTPLGPRDGWPANLRTLEQLCLDSLVPMALLWGPEFVLLYNDAYRPILGHRHPQALGRCARDCWPEQWAELGPTLAGVFGRGASISLEHRIPQAERDGVPHERTFTSSYSPVRDGDRIAGVFCAVRETTGVAREHDPLVSEALQLALLPKGLPDVAGLQFSAEYHAAKARSQAGGDWYDAFELSDGRIVVSVGDVMGSGSDSAVTMAAARQAIRGASQIYPDPRALLDAADRALLSEQPDRIVTAFVGVFEPITGYLSFASAGHPPPMLRRADGTIIELIDRSLPLGLRSEASVQRESAPTVHVEPGALLVLYTDGLIEATRDAALGESRLRAALARAAIERAENAAEFIRVNVLDDAPSDDVAILTVAVGERSSADTARWTFDTTDAAVSVRLRRDLTAMLCARGASASEAGDAELILGELLGNVVRHTQGDVDVALDLTGEFPVVHVLDRGRGFTFIARLPQDEMSETGRGLFISAMLARDFTVVRRPDGGSHARAVLPCRLRRSAIRSIA